MAWKGGVTIDGFTDFRCSCRSIKVIAVHTVNSGPNNLDYSRSSSFLRSLSFFFSLYPSILPFLHFTLTFFLRDPTNSRCYFASAKRFVASTEYVLWRKLYEGRARRQSYIPTVHTGRIPDVNTYNRRKVQTSVPWPSIRSCCRELPC